MLQILETTCAGSTLCVSHCLHCSAFLFLLVTFSLGTALQSCSQPPWLQALESPSHGKSCFFPSSHAGNFSYLKHESVNFVLLVIDNYILLFQCVLFLFNSLWDIMFYQKFYHLGEQLRECLKFLHCLPLLFIILPPHNTQHCCVYGEGSHVFCNYIIVCHK